MHCLRRSVLACALTLVGRRVAMEELRDRLLSRMLKPKTVYVRRGG